MAKDVNSSSNLGIYAIIAIVAIVAIVSLMSSGSVNFSPSGSTLSASSDSNLIGDGRYVLDKITSEDIGSCVYNRGPGTAAAVIVSGSDLPPCPDYYYVDGIAYPFAGIVPMDSELFADDTIKFIESDLDQNTLTKFEKSSEEQYAQKETRELSDKELAVLLKEESKLYDDEFMIEKESESDSFASLSPEETLKELGLSDFEPFDKSILSSKSFDKSLLFNPAKATPVSKASKSNNLVGGATAVPPPGCLYIAQFQLTMNSDYYVNKSCVVFSNSLNLGTGTMYVFGNTELYCDGHELIGTGNQGMVVEDTAKVYDCTVKHRTKGIGFVIDDQAQVHGSLAEDNNVGFWVKTTGSGVPVITQSQAVANRAIGFSLGYPGFWGVQISADDLIAKDNGFASNSFAKGGFFLSADASISNSEAINNIGNGFYFGHYSHVTNSLAKGNTKNGFYLSNSNSAPGNYHKVSNSEAVDNGLNGFYLGAASQVYNSKSVSNMQNGFYINKNGQQQIHKSVAVNNQRNGFVSVGWGRIYSSEAIDNFGYGFVLRDSSAAFASVAETNHRSGVVLFDGAFVEKMRSLNNYFHGILVRTLSSSWGANVQHSETIHNQRKGVLVVPSASLNSPAGVSCGNGQEDLFTQCSPSTGICGGFTANQYTAGSMNFPPSPAIGTLTPC